MRKLFIALIATLAMIGGLTSVAFASEHFSGTAQLTSADRNVFPGGAQEFSIDVKNTSIPDTDGTVPGIGGTRGARINYVQVIFPSAAGITTSTAGSLSAPAGWDAAVVQDSMFPDLHAVKFTTNDEGIAPDETLRFTFPADVAAPSSADVAGAFKVSISEDAGRTTEMADGSLDTVIRVLEVVDLAASAPGGVTDGSATGGQDVTIGVNVRNHAAQALTVSPALSSSVGDDAIGTVPDGSIASNGERLFEFPVTLAPQASGQRTSTFTGSASTAAAEASKAFGLRVQASPALTLDPASFSPKFVRSNTLLTYDFAVKADKTNPPSLDVRDCTLSFAGTTTSLASPVEFGEGSTEAILSFESTKVTGAEGKHSVEVQCEGVDGNGVPASFDLVDDLTDVITIDNTAPIVDVGLTIPDDQTAVKSGDTLEIAVDVDETTEMDFIQLVPNEGEPIECEASGSDTRFSCTLTPAFADGTTQALAQAQVTDQAGNIGGGASEVIVVDIKAPVFEVARTHSTKEVEVHFDEQTTISGGCNPSQWRVEGHVVSRVEFQNGPCTAPPTGQGEQGDGSKVRVLVLTDELDSIDETPDVSYEPSSGPFADNVFDGARQEALAATVTAVPGIVPAAPELGATATRTDHLAGGREDAYREEGTGTKPETPTFYTNQTGEDLEVGFSGGRQGYRIEAVDSNGNTLRQSVVDSSGNGELIVPIGNADDRFVRGIRLRNAAGAGEITYFDVVLDRVSPTISEATAADNEVTVSLSEVLPFGENFANDWFGWEDTTDADGNKAREYYQPLRVTGSGAQRLLDFDFQNLGPFGGVLYRFDSEDAGGKRYEDRAGNQMADSES